MVNLKKTARVASQYLKSRFVPSSFFIHIAPTKRCNLKCSYCYQYDNSILDMTLDDFNKNVDNLYELGLSIVAFTGGEPLLWDNLLEAIDYCTEKNIFTQLTTNGMLLTNALVDSLAKEGLDYLMVSVDSVMPNNVSNKNMSRSSDIVDIMKYARSKGIFISWNAVLTKKNYHQVYEIIEISHKESIPLSIGLVTPSPKEIFSRDNDGLFFDSDNDRELLEDIVNKLTTYSDQNYPIIEPKEYFEGITRYVKGEIEWDCNKARKGGLQVSPESKIYWCAKLNSTSNYKAYSITRENIIDYRNRLKNIISKCNRYCYSNCAFNSYFFQTHKTYFLFKILPLFLSQYSYNGKGR